MGSLGKKHGIFVTLTSWGILYVGSIVGESCLFIHILLIYERVYGKWSSSSSQRFSIRPPMRSLIVGIVSPSWISPTIGFHNCFKILINNYIFIKAIWSCWTTSLWWVNLMWIFNINLSFYFFKIMKVLISKNELKSRSCVRDPYLQSTMCFGRKYVLGIGFHFNTSCNLQNNCPCDHTLINCVSNFVCFSTKQLCPCNSFQAPIHVCIIIYHSWKRKLSSENDLV